MTDPLVLIRQPSSLTSDDAVDLRWYFSVNGVACLEGSTLAAMLYRAELYGRPALPCMRCGGNIEQDEAGSGFVQDKPTEHATEKQAELLALLDVYQSKIPRSPDRVCPECKGTGWSTRVRGGNGHGELTARPTGSSIRDGGGVSVSDANVHRLGVVSRRLSRAESVLPGAMAVLERFYGPSRADGGGGLVSIWELTPSGKTLLRSNHLKLDPARYFENERAAEQMQPNQVKRSQFRAADKQASELLRQASKAWNWACGRKTTVMG